jgi:predicted MFS family arabinose efflux permease
MSSVSPAPTRITEIFKGLGDPVILALGATQTIGYGTLYYAYGVLAPAISQDMGVGLDGFFAIFTAGLLLGGFMSPIAGRRIDRHGARLLMGIGSVMASAGLLACALSPSPLFFMGAVIFAEITACLVFYDAAFAALAQIHRHSARRSITLITLIAGFASTIFWPLTQMLLASLGWRGTLGVYALANLAICAPLHFWFLKGATPLAAEEKASEGGAHGQAIPAILSGAARERAFRLYAVAICVSGFAYAAFPFHMLRIIQSEGFTAEAAAVIAMGIGPAQVLARLAEVLGGHRFDPMMTGRVALSTLAISIALLLSLGGSLVTTLAFAALYGASQGLMTIARGTVPLQLFGPHGYGALLGRVTGLRMLVSGVAPFAFSLAATHAGMKGAMTLSLLLALAALAAFLAIRPPPRAAGAG